MAFKADQLSISGTFVHPKSEDKTPAALLIAGSGPTNRDGNPRPNGNENSLKNIAFPLAHDGVASLRYDKIGSGKISTKTMGHYLKSPEADEASEQLQSTIHQLRTRGTVPPHLKYNLGQLFSPNNLKFLRQIDRIDPADLGAELPSGFPVLLTCSDADIQVTCSDVAHLASGLKRADVDLAHITLHGVDHVLKEDDSKGSANYNKDLPFSHELAGALKKFTAKIAQ